MSYFYFQECKGTIKIFLQDVPHGKLFNLARGYTTNFMPKFKQVEKDHLAYFFHWHKTSCMRHEGQYNHYLILRKISTDF